MFRLVIAVITFAFLGVGGAAAFAKSVGCSNLKGEALLVEPASATLARPDLRKFFAETDNRAMLEWGDFLAGWSNAATWTLAVCDAELPSAKSEPTGGQKPTPKS